MKVSDGLKRARRIERGLKKSKALDQLDKDNQSSTQTPRWTAQESESIEQKMNESSNRLSKKKTKSLPTAAASGG